MGEAIRILKHEHEIIKEMLGSFEQLLGDAESGRVIGRAVVNDYVDFFIRFADGCHHAKEEKSLFRALELHGFSREVGPLAIVLAEHAQARKHMDAIASLDSGKEILLDHERRRLVEEGRAYVALLRSHMEKEDQSLYAIAMRAIPKAELAGLVEEFRVLEAESEGDSLEWPVKVHRILERQGAVRNA